MEEWKNGIAHMGFRRFHTAHANCSLRRYLSRRWPDSNISHGRHGDRDGLRLRDTVEGVVLSVDFTIRR